MPEAKIIPAVFAIKSRIKSFVSVVSTVVFQGFLFISIKKKTHVQEDNTLEAYTVGRNLKKGL